MLTQALKQESKWSPYLAILPQDLESLVFWSEPELLELQASSVVKKIGKAGAEDMFSKHIVPMGLHNYNTDMAHRVASIIMAYAFDIPEKAISDDDDSIEEESDELVSEDGEDEKIILSMVPLADMLNADADRNNARLCCDNANLEMRAIKYIKQGSEILNDYGQLPQSDLLRRYGYITENYAAFDVAEIETEFVLSIFRANKPFHLPNHQILEPLGEEELEHRVSTF